MGIYFHYSFYSFETNGKEGFYRIADGRGWIFSKAGIPAGDGGMSKRGKR